MNSCCVSEKLVTASKGLIAMFTTPWFLIAVGGFVLAEIGRIFEGLIANRAYMRLVLAVNVLFMDLCGTTRISIW